MRFSLTICSLLLLGDLLLNGRAVAAESKIPKWQPVAAQPFLLRGSEARLLGRLKNAIETEQFDDALETVLLLLESDAEGLVPYGENRYISLTEYCHRQIAQFPPATLVRYRSLIDTLAEDWYRQGIETRDAVSLERVVDEAFCSSWGDDALLALGELALEQANYEAARFTWRRIHSEVPPSEDDLLMYPDSQLPPAEIAARLVLVSIRAEQSDRAEAEFTWYAETYPHTRGQLGGREVHFVSHLEELLAQARQWPAIPTDRDWTTFGRRFERNTAVETPPSMEFTQAWSQTFRPAAQAVNSSLRVFPTIVDNRITLQTSDGVQAWALDSGKMLFSLDATIFQSPKFGEPIVGNFHYTLTAADGVAYGVTRVPVGPVTVQARKKQTATFWGIDLDRQGALLLEQVVNEDDTIFTAAPVVVEGRAYVPVFTTGHVAQLGVACYDVPSGRRIWQRSLCQANTPATGRANELLHHTLAYRDGVIYCTTGLGVIAAIDAENGKMRWLSSYARRATEYYYSRIHTTIYHEGKLFVLPNDAQTLFVLEATTGDEIWRREMNSSEAELIGAVDGKLAVAEEGYLLLDGSSGAVLAENPELTLHGSGVVAGSEVFWPREEEILRIELTTGEVRSATLKLPEPGGANLLWAENRLVATGPAQITVFESVESTSELPTESKAATRRN